MVIVNKIRNILSGSNNTNKEEPSDSTPINIVANRRKFFSEVCVGDRVAVTATSDVNEHKPEPETITRDGCTEYADWVILGLPKPQESGDIDCKVDYTGLAENVEIVGYKHKKHKGLFHEGASLIATVSDVAINTRTMRVTGCSLVIDVSEYDGTKPAADESFVKWSLANNEASSKTVTERFSPELCREIAMRHHVGERIDVVVSNIVPYGVFCSIDGTAYNGLLHVTGIKGLGNRAPEDVFRRGQELSCTIKGIELDPKVKIFLETTVAETEAAPRAFSPKPNPECIAAKWVKENPGVSEDAHKWLVSMVTDAPLHGSLLSELRERFGIPKPVSGWIRLFDDLESLPAVNDRCPHPVVGLRSRMHDRAYLDSIRKVLPAEDASPKVTPKANKPAVVQNGAKLILIDASCLLRNDAFGLAGCEALMNSLKANGFKPFALIDAATPHNLNDAGKAFVNELVASDDGKLVPGGTRADDYLLALADKMGVDIISYDRYRDFAENYPWTQEKEGKRRIHAPEFLFDRIVIPSLGICD